MPPRLPAALAALLDAGSALIRQSSSGRVALARSAHLIDLPVLDAAYAQATEPLDPKRVRKALHELDEFDPAPLAVRPAAQVHTGELDGAAVAAKIARPGLAATVRSDFALLDIVRTPLAAVFASTDVAAILEEVREGALDELDLEHEGGAQRQAGRVLRCVDGLRVPAVHSAATTEEVLVMERLDGPTLLEAVPADPDALAELLLQAHVVAWRDGGFILTDLRPGHVVLLEDGGVGLLGAGVSRPGERERAQALLDAARAVADDDAGAFAEAIGDRLGVLDAATARDALPLVRDVLGPFADGPARLDARALVAMGERALGRAGELMALAARVTPQPSDVAAARMLGQLAAVLSRLGVTRDWLRI